MTESDGAALELRVLAGNPSDTELAAVTAVVSGLVTEAEEQGMASVPPVRSAWSFSQRQLRSAIVPGPGAWNRQGR